MTKRRRTQSPQGSHRDTLRQATIVALVSGTARAIVEWLLQNLS